MNRRAILLIRPWFQGLKMHNVPTTENTILNPKTNAKRFVYGHQLLNIFPGVLLSTIIAAISLYLGQLYGGPIMLYAIVIGAFFNSIASKHYLKTGIKFSSNNILKIGVALLAVKITVVDVIDLGWQTAALILTGVAATLIIGMSLGRLLGLTKDNAIISAGSVAICGSSAALAIASVLPQNKKTESNTIVTVIAVTALSTLAMVLYPFITKLMNFSDTQSGIFMGVTIHNVAQVVGAGYMISDTAGETATIVKLMRVACLVPIIIIISLMFNRGSQTKPDTKPIQLLPLFMVGFIIIIFVNSLGLIPTHLNQGLGELSRWCLVIAVAALGMKTSIHEIIQVGFKPFLVLTLQTIFLAVLALLLINYRLII